MISVIANLPLRFSVIADHIRAISFTIADGQLPSNTGAGYVIRRILRRAVRYYYSSLDYKEPLLYKLIPVIADQFANVFPELKEQESFVARVVREEEEAFMRTLSKGITYFEQHISDLDQRVISGAFAFTLFDTYGFPIDLTLINGEGERIRCGHGRFSEIAYRTENTEVARLLLLIQKIGWL